MSEFKMSDEVVAQVRAHIATLPNGMLVCPICRGTKWDLGGPQDEPTGGFLCPWVGPYPRQGVALLEVLVMCCDSCGYLCHFLWSRVQKAPLKGEPPKPSERD